MIQATYVPGSRRGRSNDLVKAMGSGGYVQSPGQPALPAEIDERVNAFLSAAWKGAWPYLGLDAT